MDESGKTTHTTELKKEEVATIRDCTNIQIIAVPVDSTATWTMTSFTRSLKLSKGPTYWATFILLSNRWCPGLTLPTSLTRTWTESVSVWKWRMDLQTYVQLTIWLYPLVPSKSASGLAISGYTHSGAWSLSNTLSVSVITYRKVISENSNFTYYIQPLQYPSILGK